MFTDRSDRRDSSSDTDYSHIPASRNLVFRAKEGGLISKETFIGPAPIPVRRTITRSAPTPVVPVAIAPVAVVPEIVAALVEPAPVVADEEQIIPSKTFTIEVRNSEVIVTAEAVPSRKLNREEIVAMMGSGHQPSVLTPARVTQPYQPIRQNTFGPAPKLVARGDRRDAKFKKSAVSRKARLLERAEALHVSCFDYSKSGGMLLRQRFGYGRSDMFFHCRSDLRKKITEAEDFSDLGKIEKYLGQMEELSIEFRKADPA